MTQKGVWVGKPISGSQNTTYDFGKTWSMQNINKIFGSYYFLGDEI